MNAVDYAVLLTAILGIAGYGIWRSRGRGTTQAYLKGRGDAHWLVIGLSVMATQASAVTFLSTPGQGYASGLGFIQNYFGAPLALIIICIVFLPIYRRMRVYTAYEYLGERFDGKTRLLAAALFLIQRGLGAGITIYAPAIVLSTVFGWSLPLTIVCSSVVAIGYTVAGGCDAVTHTQKLQLTLIFAGMAAAGGILLHKLLGTFSLGEITAIASARGKLHAVDFSLDPHKRYTFWSGIIGGGFLALAYFGTDQSQVQRYIGAESLRDARLGLMFNAVCKIPMQLFILGLGVLLFVFYQTGASPVMFNRAGWSVAVAQNPSLMSLEIEQAQERQQMARDFASWLKAHRQGRRVDESQAALALESDDRAMAVVLGDVRTRVKDEAHSRGEDSDYVFIRFILDHLPHGLIGLLVTAFFAATLSAKSAELNALASTTVIDVYRHALPGPASDRHLLIASRAFTVFWGLVAMGFALTASLSENLIQATNILGSLFYGVVLGMFLTAFFLRGVGGTAIFISALVSEAAVIAMYFKFDIGYLWYNAIGCLLCMGLAVLIQAALPGRRVDRGFEVVVRPLP